MIFGGKRVRTNLPVVETGDRYTFSVALAGTTLVTLYEFTDFGELSEVLIKVPTMAAAATVVVTLHDQDYLLAGDARYTSAALAETATHDIKPARVVCPGDKLCVKANAGAGTETVEGVIYEVGV